MQLFFLFTLWNTGANQASAHSPRQIFDTRQYTMILSDALRGVRVLTWGSMLDMMLRLSITTAAALMWLDISSLGVAVVTLRVKSEGAPLENTPT